MAVADDIESSIASNKLLLTDKLDDLANLINAAAIVPWAQNAYDTVIATGTTIVTDAGTAVDAVKTRWDSNINVADPKYTFNDGDLLTNTLLDEIAEGTLRDNAGYQTSILTADDKNILGYVFKPLSDYNTSIWQSLVSPDGDFTYNNLPKVQESTFIAFTNKAEVFDTLLLNDTINTANANTGSKGFYYPNSFTSASIQKALSAYIKETSTKTRETWNTLVTAINGYMNTLIESSISKLEADVSFNKNVGELDSKLADAFMVLQGIINNINIKKYSFEEDQVIALNKNAYEVLTTIYNANIEIYKKMFDAQAEVINSKWDVESKRVSAELQALETNANAFGKETAYEVEQYSKRIENLYKGLSQDIASMKAIISANTQGLSTSFSNISNILESMTENVISVKQGSGA